MAEPKPSDAPSGRFGRGFVTECWYFAALSRDLKPGAVLRVEIMGEAIALARTRSGQVLALRDACPHRAAPLSAGRVAGETLACPYHGWKFGADGVCTEIPSLTPDQPFDLERVKTRRWPAAESQGMIFLWVGQDEPTEPPPTFDGIVGAPRLSLAMDFDVHIDHAVIGLMDPAHGPYVHRAWWWRSERSSHEKAKAYGPSPFGFVMKRHPPSKNSRAYALLGGAPTTEIVFRLPAYRWEHVLVGKRQVLALTCLTPLAEDRTRISQVVWSDHPVFSLLGPIMRVGARRFLAQDGDMVNLQRPGLVGEPVFLWIDDADTPAKWYQALKREWIACQAEGRAFTNPVTERILKWRS